MNGKIYFSSYADLAEFLHEFQKTGNTSVFEVTEKNGQFVLEFTGGF